jgi:small subunit ribosomal protein S3Ae
MAMMIEDTKKEEKKTASKPLAQKKRGVDKWKKKVWYSIFTPEEFEKREIASTVAEKPEQVMGRTLWMSVGEIARQPRLSHIALKFRVTDVQGQKAYTQLDGFAMQDSYIRRVVRRRSSKLEVVCDVVTKDDQKAHIKAVTITGQKITQAQGTTIRRMMREELERAAKAREFRILAQELIFGNIATAIVKRAKKVASVKRTEIVKCNRILEKASKQ